MKDKLPPKDQLIIGIHAIREVLLHVPQKMIRLFITKSKTEGRKKELLDLCEQKRIPISYFSEDDLSYMAGSDSHQGIAAHIHGRTFLSVDQFLKTVEDKSHSLVLMADQIFDPQNLGALMRSAEVLGASGFCWSKNRGSDLTPTVAKASCGASELLPLIRVSNLAEGVSAFQEGGFEAVVAILNPSSENAFSFKFAPKTLLIIGSEGEGVQPLIQKRADRSIYIPAYGHVESLNAAQAAAVLLALYAKN
jgi:23S rRNA (guanosine2251-2'-O)-methyltransferase